jgi:hypothetical protein
MLRSRDQSRAFLRTKNLCRVWIEGRNHRGPAGGRGIPGGSPDYGLVTAMHSVENANGEENRTGHFRQFRNRSQDSHKRSSLGAAHPRNFREG